jgi:hypothetical protein
VRGFLAREDLNEAPEKAAERLEARAGGALLGLVIQALITRPTYGS